MVQILMKKTMAITMIALSICAAAPVFTGCGTTAQKTAYKTAAVKMYNVIAGQGKTTVSQNLAVKAAYTKYQVTFAAVCDAGAAYAAAGASNVPANVSAASAVLQQAISNSSTSIQDILNLIKAYGVKL
jgi:hypothetical protein